MVQLMDLLMINLKDYHMMVNNILIILYINKKKVNNIPTLSQK